MANYDLNRLNTSEFENLVQALSTKIFNYENIIFGAGPDGAREATFEGTCTLPDENPLKGYYVIQAKYKECSSSEDKKDWKWAKNELEKEMGKFQDQDRNLKTPDVYLFFTNIQFTGVSEKGGRDKIEEFKKQYLQLIPNIRIYGYDDICKFLDNNRDVATAYSSYILPGDILHELYQSIKINNTRDEKILYRFLNKEFEEELYSKLEQANELTDQKINLDKVFVDLNITGPNLHDDDNKFVHYCINIGNNSWKSEQYKMVFIGGPGQGKSTVTQFLTQIYRAYFLKNFNNTLSPEAKNFIDHNMDTTIQPKCYRFPIKIILSEFSEWLNNQKKEGLSSSVLSYIQNRIERRADEKFSEFGNFRIFLEKLSFLFIFDGLDEVPSTSNRDEVIYEIDNFINHELKTVNCDALIIATTRPQGYSNEFNPSRFRHFKLNDLDKSTCLKYLENLVNNTVSSADERSNQLKILKEALSTEVTSNIMKTPLQATIMAILVKSGGKPSKDKFSLFNDYYQTMLKREKQKNVLKIISEHEDYINEIHYRLGNKLQISSQKQESSSALLDIESFKNLVEEYFTEQELTSEDKEKYTSEIMEAITDRLVFITENQDKKIGFAIRSTQEYFSAMMNVHNISDQNVIKNIRVISNSIYWRNVFIFMLGYIAKNKDYLLDSLDSYLSELNGSSIDFTELSLSKVSKYGSILSLEILSESILSNRPKEENKFIKHLQELTDRIAPNNIDYLLQRLRPKIVENGIIEILKKSVQSNQLHKRMCSWKIIALLSENNQEILNQFIYYWTKEENEELYYLKLFVENNVFHEFILEKIYKYIKLKDLKSLKILTLNPDFLIELCKFPMLLSNEKAKFFLIENIFTTLQHHIIYSDNSTFKVFLELLDIESNEESNIFYPNKKIFLNIDSFDLFINNIKDYSRNELVLELYKKTSKHDELSFLSSYFDYLLKPSLQTLKEFFYKLKSKIIIYNSRTFLYIFDNNWQLHYIINELLNETSEKEILETMYSWGNNFEDFIEYEKQLTNINNINKNSKYVLVERSEDDFDDDSKIILLYEEVYEKNKLKLDQHFMWTFISEISMNRTIDNKKLHKITNEIINLFNEKNNMSEWIKNISIVAVMSVIDKKELMNLSVNVNLLNLKFSTSYLSHHIVFASINKLIDVIKFTQEANSLIKILFYIVIGFANGRSDDTIDYNILFELKYDNMEIQTYGYLLSLIHPSINTDSNKMTKIKKFLISRALLDIDIFEYTLKIVYGNNLDTDLIKDLLLELYKMIKKDSIPECLLASNYENEFQDMFQNQVIEI